jgi:hypothetical protein
MTTNQERADFWIEDLQEIEGGFRIEYTWRYEGYPFVGSGNIDNELEHLSGVKFSPAQTRAIARALWSLVDEGVVNRDSFPDSYLDVVLPAELEPYRVLAQAVRAGLGGLPDHPWIPGADAGPVADAIKALDGGFAKCPQGRYTIAVG